MIDARTSKVATFYEGNLLSRGCQPRNDRQCCLSSSYPHHIKDPLPRRLFLRVVVCDFDDHERYVIVTK